VLRSLTWIRADTALPAHLLSSHVDFAGVLFVIWGALTAVLGVSTLSLGIGAASLVASPHRADGGQFAAGLAAVALVLLAVIAIIWGCAHIAIGLPLRRRRPWARLAALMLATVDLLLFPYGTALGGYVLWVLLGEGPKRLFDG
jgi:hypothetical protein